MAQTMFLQALTLQVIGSGLVGEPANETEKCFHLDSAFLHGPPPSPLHALLARRPERIGFSQFFDGFCLK